MLDLRRSDNASRSMHKLRQARMHKAYADNPQQAVLHKLHKGDVQAAVIAFFFP
jgi:hypothetical protein